MRKLKLEVGDCVEIHQIPKQSEYSHKKYEGMRGDVISISNGMAEVSIRIAPYGKLDFKTTTCFINDLFILVEAQ